MANRFGDLSPSSSRACGLEEENGENKANGKAPADRDSQQTNLKKVLEMPMYDNEDLGSDKVQEVDARSISFHDAEGIHLERRGAFQSAAETYLQQPESGASGSIPKTGKT